VIIPALPGGKQIGVEGLLRTRKGRMRRESEKLRIRRQLRELFRSLDFALDRSGSGKGPAKDQGRFAEIYQQLGLAWELLGLQCRHWDGYRRTREGRMVCRICGKVEGAGETWLVLPGEGRKRIGRMVTPASRKTFPEKRAATVLKDGIEFHGARLGVRVHHAYESSLAGQRITIAAERSVTLRERGVRCSVDDQLVVVRLEDADGRAGRRRFGGFPWELSRRVLRNFPVILEFDDRDRFLGLTIFRPRQPARRPGGPRGRARDSRGGARAGGPSAPAR